MKVSLSWIFDHLEQGWQTIDIPELVNKFNTTSAEIDGFEHITIPVQHFTLGTLVKQDGQKATVFSSELNKEFTLPARTDGIINGMYMLFVESDKARWASLADWHSQKEGLIGLLSVQPEDVKGGWKKTFESQDYVLTIDNKSITHRPDMWSHRGIAREISALYAIKLKPEQDLLLKTNIEFYKSSATASQNQPFAINVENSALCKSFAAAYIPHLKNQPSLLWMAHRLARVDSRPIDAIVDTTNYVMFDIGQPMHAFDAQKIQSTAIKVQLAKEGQALELLDDQSVTLSAHDLVITNGNQPISLAGIMGGSKTAVQKDTTALFIEAGCFDASTIRQSSVRHKRRTESSVRFEKSLDANGPRYALQRFLKLLKDNHISYTAPDTISFFGDKPHEQEIQVAHDLIASRLGVEIESKRVEDILRKLGFECSYKDAHYRIKVPTFRSSKEAFIPEDIIEEVGRFVGYGTIPLALPKIELQPSDNNNVYNERQLKRYCAYAFKAHEVSNYAIYDEQFLKDLNWEPQEAVGIQNPISDNWKRMVTSLVPHLLKCVTQNKPIEAVRFFEYNRVWEFAHKEVQERMMVAGCAYQQKNEINFFDFKAEIEQLLKMFHVQAVWQHVQEAPYPWFHPYMTAEIMHNGVRLGYAGVCNNAFTKKIMDGHFFIFEIDAASLFDSLDRYVPHFEPLPKYPVTWLDISLLIPQSITVQQLKESIQSSDDRIFKVELVDFYENKEWVDKRSVTLRFWARDITKTLAHEDIDHLYDHVKTSVKQLGATIR